MQLAKRKNSTPLIHLDELSAFLVDKCNPENGFEVVMLGLTHFTDQGPETINVVKCENASPEKITELGEKLYRHAMAAADTFSMPQRYGIIVFGPDEDVLASYPFRLAPSVSVMQGGESEPPNERGVIAQIMRITEGYGRIGAQQSEKMMRMLGEENERLRSRCAQLEDKNFEIIKLREELLDGKAKRDLEIKESERWSERIDRILELGEKQVLPAMVEKYSAFGPIRGFFKSLNEEQLLKIAGELTNEQKMKLAELASMLNGSEDGEKTS